MDTISFNLGYILFNALIIWVFLSNHFYLKIFFLKVESQKSKRRNYEKPSSNIFDQVFGGETIPQYIKNAILKCQDAYQLLSLYLASKSLIDLGVYNKVVKNGSESKYDFCVSLFVGLNSSTFNKFIWGIRGFSILTCVFLSFIFFSKVFLNEKILIPNNDQFIIISIFTMFLLMPYNIFSKSRFFDKLCSIFVFLSSILVALFSVVYIQKYPDNFIFNKFFLSFFLGNLMIAIGAYSYIGYAKLEYMVKFFELLIINLEQSGNNENPVIDITTPPTTS